MPTHNRGRLARTPILLATFLLVLAPAARAQAGTFGSQVLVGDPDYVPLVKKDAARITVSQAHAGDTTSAKDDCIYLDAGTGPGIQVKDIRLTPCRGAVAGTQLTDNDWLEKLEATTAPAVQVFTADFNGNAKYDKGDGVYLSTSAAATGWTAAIGAGAWTLRVSPVPCAPGGATTCFAPGSFVLPGDWDDVAFGAAAAAGKWSLVEREDKGWYLAPLAAPTCGTLAKSAAIWVGAAPASDVKACSAGAVQANGLVPANSVRVAIAGTAALQPNVVATAMAVGDPAGLQAGEPMSVVVEFRNAGTTAGSGLLVTRLDGAILDARLTPVLGPGEKGAAVVMASVPAEAAGPMGLAVNDMFQIVHVKGGAGLGATHAPDLEALIARLEARITQLESPPKVAAAEASQVQGLPSAGPAALLVVLVMAGLALRRRG